MKVSEMPDERLILFLKFLFGFSTLTAYFILAVIIALFHIEEKTSFGLPIVLGALGPLGGAFVGWAFGDRRS